MFYIGITLEKEAFRVAVIKKEKKNLLVESTHAFSYGSDSVKLFYNSPFFHTGKPVFICSGLDCNDLFIRKLCLPLQGRAKILKTLPFQLESLIPFSEETPLICTQIKSLNNSSSSITVIATTESKLQTHLNHLKNLEIHPDQVSSLPSALMRFISWQFPQENKILCLNAKEGIVNCVVIEKEEILLSQTLDINTDPMAFEKLALFLKQKGTIDETTPWVLTGELSYEEHLKSLFSGKQLKLINPSSSSFAMAIGLALDSAIANESSVQFCQKHLTQPHTFQKRKKQLLTYVACCTAATLMMGICSSILLNKKERLLAIELNNYIPSLKQTASAEEIKQGLISWESSLKGSKNTFALIPNVPRVSDLLAYVSTHPCLTTKEGESLEGTDIESIHYSLVKYPKITDPSSPYVAQVELRFSTTLPRVARDFHEALLKGDLLVNPKKEIKWQNHNKNYHVSFELNKGIFQ